MFNINTGKVKKPKTFTEVPMPDSVVEIVNDWGKTHEKTKEKNQLSLETETRRNTRGTITSKMMTR